MRIFTNFDEDFGEQRLLTLDAHEIVALQLSGVSDEDISEIVPELGISECLSEKYGDDIVTTLNSNYEAAKDKYHEFLIGEYEDETFEFIQKNKVIYMIEANGDTGAIFEQVGAVRVPAHIAMELLNDATVVPGADGYRYTNEVAIFPNKIFWKNMYLLHSLEEYYQAYKEIYGDYRNIYVVNSLDEFYEEYNEYYKGIKDRKDPLNIMCNLELINERFDVFPWNLDAMKRCRYYLEDLDYRSPHECHLLYESSKIYLEENKAIIPWSIDRKYINTYTDEYGVIYDDTKKLLIDVNRELFDSECYQIAEGCEFVDNGAFAWLPNLRHVQIPASVRIIGSGQFTESGLKELVIPDTVDLIGSALFWNCKSLQKVILPKHIEHLGNNMFCGAEALEVISMGKVYTIGKNCFRDTTSLKSLELRNTREFGENCFKNSGLTKLTLHGNVKKCSRNVFSREVEVSIDCIPTPYNYPFPKKLKLSSNQYCQLINEVWLKDIAGLYALCRFYSNSGWRRFRPLTLTQELYDYLKWISHVELNDDDKLKVLKESQGAEYLTTYFIVMVAQQFMIAGELFWPQEICNLAVEFKNQLEKLFDVFNGKTPISQYIHNIDFNKELEYGFSPSDLEDELQYIKSISNSEKILAIPLRKNDTHPQIRVNQTQFNRFINNKRKFWRMKKKLITAERINADVQTGYGYWYDPTYNKWNKRKQPTTKQARDYIHIVKALRHYYENCWPMNTIRITSEQASDYERRKAEYCELHLDMRDVIFHESDKVGLKNLLGDVIVPAEFDEIPERYDCVDESWGGYQSISIPVVKQGKYALYLQATKKHNGKLVTDFVYDIIFRYYGSRITYFVCVQNTKKGVIDSLGDIIIPCEQDEIYEMQDLDGVIPFQQEKLWGLAYGNICTEAIFDDIKIISEDYCQVCYHGEWGYIDINGQFTKDRDKAFFASLYDSEK